VLAELGIQPITTVGESFDPHLHEAAATEETDEFPPNSISGELLKGYRIGDRVIRHSIVRVARPAPKSAEQKTFEKMLGSDDASSDSPETETPSE
jgi:hypothetical protein